MDELGLEPAAPELDDEVVIEEDDKDYRHQEGGQEERYGPGSQAFAAIRYEWRESMNQTQQNHAKRPRHGYQSSDQSFPQGHQPGHRGPPTTAVNGLINFENQQQSIDRTFLANTLADDAGDLRIPTDGINTGTSSGRIKNPVYTTQQIITGQRRNHSPRNNSAAEELGSHTAYLQSRTGSAVE